MGGGLNSRINPLNGINIFFSLPISAAIISEKNIICMNFRDVDIMSALQNNNLSPFGHLLPFHAGQVSSRWLSIYIFESRASNSNSLNCK